MGKNYVETINDLLGDELFSELSDELYLKVNKKYPRINIKNATEIVEGNMAVILIIGIEKARGCSDEKIKERVDWYNACPKSLLINKSIAGISKDYEKYITVIKENVAKNGK